MLLRLRVQMLVDLLSSRQMLAEFQLGQLSAAQVFINLPQLARQIIDADYHT